MISSAGWNAGEPQSGVSRVQEFGFGPDALPEFAGVRRALSARFKSFQSFSVSEADHPCDRWLASWPVSRLKSPDRRGLRKLPQQFGREASAGRTAVSSPCTLMCIISVLECDRGPIRPNFRLPRSSVGTS